MKDPIVIVGLGKTSLSCLRYLLKQGITRENIAVTDNREQPPGLNEIQQNFPQLRLSVGRFDEKLLDQAQKIIVTPGVSLQEPAIHKQLLRGIQPIGDIELFAQKANAPIIAITGTNGKSTVTTLVGEMAKTAGLNVKVGGNLGTPALDLLDETTELYVLELSSFQLETTYSLKTISATVLNITPDHLDRYQSLQDYIDAKQRIYQRCAIPVINREDPISFSGLKNFSRALSFGLNEPQKNQFGLRDNYLAYDKENLIAANELQIKGRHQIANALAALALGHAAQIPLAAMLQALKNFRGLIHRCQWLAQIDGVNWYNDSKGTNVNSSLAAITGLGDAIQGKLILIAGGLGKNQDFSPLREPINKYVRSVILIGQDAQQIAAALSKETPIISARTLEEAVTIAKQQARSGDAVLLSPACASYDMFRNFEHRGEVFIAAVKKLE
jgi:UDP-N-acetylmuramoylalanine--D-glutamate ligase